MCAIVSVLVNHPFILYVSRLGIQIRLTCCSLIYRKVNFSIWYSLLNSYKLFSQTLKITKSMQTDGFNGKVINLMSTDVLPFDQSMFFIHLLWKGPIELCIFGYLIYKELNFYGLLGIGFILCFIPIQSACVMLLA